MFLLQFSFVLSIVTQVLPAHRLLRNSALYVSHCHFFQDLSSLPQSIHHPTLTVTVSSNSSCIGHRALKCFETVGLGSGSHWLLMDAKTSYFKSI
jgi:hypothetical protein